MGLSVTYVLTCVVFIPRGPQSTPNSSFKSQRKEEESLLMIRKKRGLLDVFGVVTFPMLYFKDDLGNFKGHSGYIQLLHFFVDSKAREVIIPKPPVRS